MENLIANVDNVKPKGVKAKVEEHAQLAMMSTRLATINTQVPMDIDFAEYKLTDPEILLQSLWRWTLRSLKKSASGRTVSWRS